jgi:O-antigen ligase
MFLAVGIALFSPQFFRDRVESFTRAESRAEDTSIQKRMGMNRDAVRAFASSPLVGVGVVGFGTWGLREGTRGISYGPGTTIHNAYLAVAAEQGLFGLIPFLLILTLAWRNFSWVRRVARVHGRAFPELSQLGLRATFIQIAFFGGLIENFFQPTVMHKSAWMLVGLATAVAGLTRNSLAELEVRSSDTPELAPDAFGPAVAPGERGFSPH